MKFPVKASTAQLCLAILVLVPTGCPGSGPGAQCHTHTDCPGGGQCAAGRCRPGAGPSDGSSFGPTIDGTGWTAGDSGGGSAGDSGACAETAFKLTETQVSFKVPKSGRFMHVKAWGAGGNGEGQCKTSDGGPGGYSEAVFAVDGRLIYPGAPLIVIVGKRGRSGMTGEQRLKFGFGNWGGGGLSGVFTGGSTITAKSSGRALIIAGGGGSAGAPGCHPGGPGNHPKAGGQSTMLGGAGADGINGGGGGYAGGTGGAKGEAGLGGSGFVSKTAKRSRLLYAAVGAGLPPHTKDSDYDGTAGKTEQSGRIVIRFVCSEPAVN